MSDEQGYEEYLEDQREREAWLEESYRGQLLSRIDELTCQLKAMLPTQPGYQELWEERRQLMEQTK